MIPEEFVVFVEMTFAKTKFYYFSSCFPACEKYLFIDVISEHKESCESFKRTLAGGGGGGD
jgi:hypothetical protein